MQGVSQAQKATHRIETNHIKGDIQASLVSQKSAVNHERRTSHEIEVSH